MKGLEEIVGQPRATGALAGALHAGRLCPSLIFHGPPGVGKLTAALMLARTLLCRAPDGAPCGSCGACRRIDARALLHPDVRVIFPEKLSDFEKSEAPEDGAAGLDAQVIQTETIANPVWTVLIDRVRQAIGFLQRRPAEGPRSVLIIDQAHRMPAEAANALLKTLEEPPEHAVLILNTPSYHALLPTLRSRCQAIPFQLVPRAALARYLADRRATDPGEATLRAALSGGRIGVALELDLVRVRARRDELLGLLGAILRQADPGAAVARAEEIARAGETSGADLEVLLSLLRDLMVAEAAPEAGTDALVHGDIGERLMELARCLGPAGPSAVDDFDAAIESIRRKGNRQLLIENALLGLLPSGAGTAPRPA